MQLIDLVCCIDHQVLFYLSPIRPVLKHFKVLRFYEQDCLKIFLLLFALLIMIQVSGKISHIAQKR